MVKAEHLLALRKLLEKKIEAVSKQLGPSGKDGKDGRDGQDGMAGIDGASGKDGADGRDGQDLFNTSENEYVDLETMVEYHSHHSGGTHGSAELRERIEELEEAMAAAAYGEQTVVNSTPMAQINAVYGLGDQADSFTGLGGTLDDTGAVFDCTTGTDPSGFSGVLSKRSVSYRAGQGMMCRFSAIFGAPAANNRQQAGFTSATDAFMFGYDDTTFGIVHEYGGFLEVQTLTVTTASTGAENATVTVDGVAYTVPLTAGTTAHNAQEIAVSLTAQVPLWRVTNNGATVVAVSFFARPAGAFAFSSGTAVAAWVQDTAGVTPGRTHIPQADWNQDVVPFDPQLGNVYQIQMQWLGFGNVFFHVENPNTGRYQLVHILKYANTSTTPSLANPTLKVGWFNGNVGTTAGSTLSGASAAGFVEGDIVWHGEPVAASAANAALTTTEVNLITLRSRWEFQGIANRIEVELESLNVASDSTKITHFTLHKGGTLAGECTWEYADQSTSVIETCKDVLVHSGGSIIGTFATSVGGSEIVDLSNITPHLEPGETYTITAHVLSGAAAAVEADLTWKELK